MNGNTCIKCTDSYRSFATVRRSVQVESFGMNMNTFLRALSKKLEDEGEDLRGRGRWMAKDFGMRSRFARRPAGQDSLPSQGSRDVASNRCEGLRFVTTLDQGIGN